MPMPLLTTKLFVPPVRKELVPRPRLIERLRADPDRKLTIISAPAGYGKTTLLAHWIHHCAEEQRSKPAPLHLCTPAPLPQSPGSPSTKTTTTRRASSPISWQPCKGLIPKSARPPRLCCRLPSRPRQRRSSRA